MVWGVLDIVCVLWTTHSTELCQEGSDELRAVLERKAAKCLLVLFKHFRQGETSPSKMEERRKPLFGLTG